MGTVLYLQESGLGIPARLAYFYFCENVGCDRKRVSLLFYYSEHFCGLLYPYILHKKVTALCFGAIKGLQREGGEAGRAIFLLALLYIPTYPCSLSIEQVARIV